ncbi:MAG: thiosulfate oxidation carrier protein SoxY [Pseudomonadota bacterium]
MLTRRNTIIGGALAIAATPRGAWAVEETAENAIRLFAGADEVREDVVDIQLPEVAENGNRVSLTLAAPGARSLMFIAPKNPIPKIAEVEFGPLTQPEITMNIRLAETQEVIALARRDDGVFQSKRFITVVVGGCGPIAPTEG